MCKLHAYKKRMNIGTNFFFLGVIFRNYVEYREMLSIIFSQKILSGRLLLVNKKNSFSSGFKLKSLTTFYIEFVVKMMLT